MGMTSPVETPLVTIPVDTEFYIDFFGFSFAHKWAMLGCVLLLLVVIIVLAICLAASRRKRKKAAGSALPPDIPPLSPTMSPPVIRVGAMQGLGSYPEQEDSYYISDPGGLSHRGVLAAMADGMGGLSGGALVSRTVCDVFSQLFTFAPAGMSPPQLLLYLLGMANKAVDQQQEGQDARGGSTLVAALIQNGCLWTISVGDSCVGLLRGGALIRLNREHTYAVELDNDSSRGFISAAEAAADPQRRALTSYIGMGALKHIDRSTQPVPLCRGDCVILMSDGVFNALSDAEIADAAAGDPVDAAKRLETLVLSRHDPRQDNFTALLLKYE